MPISSNYTTLITTAPLDQDGKVREFEHFSFFTLPDMNRFIQIFDAHRKYGQFVMHNRLYYGFTIDADICLEWRRRLQELVVREFIERCEEVPHTLARFDHFLLAVGSAHGFKVI